MSLIYWTPLMTQTVLSITFWLLGKRFATSGNQLHFLRTKLDFVPVQF
jgi:hypothetical protein